MSKKYIYKCTRKRCRQYGKEFEACSPADAKLGTGYGVRCPTCGDIARLVRVETVNEA